MINLLPDDTKRDIRAARMNVTLLRYNLLTLGGLAGLFLICLFAYIILGVNQSSFISKSTDNSAKAQTFAEVRKQAEEYRSNLTIASKVLNNSVNYTAVIFDITKLLPDGVVLDGINLNAADFGQQTTFSAHAKSYEQAQKLKDNFQKSTVFSNVFFQSLTDASSDESNSAYPISIVVSVKLNKAVQQ